MAMRDDIARNRFLKLPRPQQVVIVLVLCGVLFVALECLSWLGLYVIWRASGRSIMHVELVSDFKLFAPKNLFVSQSEYRPYYLYGLRSDIEITPRTTFGTDRHGLLVNHRDQSGRDLTVQSGAYRIFLFGNSTIMGVGSETSLAAYLESDLNMGAERRFEVVTAGADGFISGQELARLSLETLHLHPDMFISLNGASDAFLTSFHKSSRPNAHLHIQILKRSLSESSLENKSFVEVNLSSADFFLRRFYSYHILLAAVSKLGLETIDPVARADQLLFLDALMDAPKFRPEGAEVYVGNLDSMSAVSRAHGIPMLFFLQPTIATELVERGVHASDREWDLLLERKLRHGYSRRQRAEVFAQFYHAAPPGGWCARCYIRRGARNSTGAPRIPAQIHSTGLISAASSRIPRI